MYIQVHMQRIFLFFLIVVSNSAYAQQFSKKDEQFVDSVMKANYKPGEPGAVLLIAQEGKPVYRKAFGLASLEFNLPNKPEYVFRIASMSKQFLSVCFLKLAQEGKLNLQDNIKKYLPDYNSHGRDITIENLLNHTNGINDFTSKKDFFKLAILNHSPQEIMTSFMNDSLSFEPGTDWGYSNSGYVVAGLIVEKVSGMSLSEYRRKYIFNPLKMTHTSVGTYDSLVVNAVYGYNGANGRFKPSEYMSWSVPYAAGDILSSVDDLLKWDNALYTQEVLKKEWLEKAWKPFVLPNGQSTNNGLGWTSNNFNGLLFIESAGGINGFSSDAIRIPSKQLYIVILSNGAPVWPPNITSAIALHLVGQKHSKPMFKRLDKNALQDYSGVYAVNSSSYAKSHSSEKQLYHYFTVIDDTLFEQSPGNPKNALLLIDKDLFVPSESGTSHFQFHRDEKGQVISVEL
ncbi:MAG: class A beta-lactamase-related serine hydrolase, partial [Sphingobacteriales bacterium]